MVLSLILIHPLLFQSIPEPPSVLAERELYYIVYIPVNLFHTYDYTQYYGDGFLIKIILVYCSIYYHHYPILLMRLI